MFCCSFVDISDNLPFYTFESNCTGREDRLAECISIIDNSTCSSGYIAITCNGKTVNKYVVNLYKCDNQCNHLFVGKRCITRIYTLVPKFTAKAFLGLPLLTITKAFP